MSTPPVMPDFRSAAFLRSHIAQTMAFYHPRAIDPAGGFFHYFEDDGTIYDRRHRHLVRSTPFVANYAIAAPAFAPPAALPIGGAVEAPWPGGRLARRSTPFS